GRSGDQAMSFRLPEAIVFDTFGSVVDWRTSLVAEMAAMAAERGVSGDWEKVAIAWRMGYYRRLAETVAGAIQWADLDHILRDLLPDVLAGHGVSGFSEADLDHISGGSHRLAPCPDAGPGIRRLKPRYILAP